MLYDGIIDCGIVCRLSSGTLFKHFLGKRGKMDAFQWFALAKMVDIVLSGFNLASRTDKGKHDSRRFMLLNRMGTHPQ